MFVITENLITGVQMLDVETGDNIENPDFPAVNMLNEFPKKAAKATKNIVRIKTTTIPWIGGFAIINIAAIKITNLALKDEYGNTLYSKDEIPLIVAGTYYNYYHSITMQKDRYYALFDGDYSNATLEFTLEYPENQNAYIGLLFAGRLTQIGTALWGLNDKFKDYGILKELISTTMFIKKPILKNIKYKVLATKAQYENFKFLYEAYREKSWLFAATKEDMPFKESFLRYGIIDKLPEIPQNNSRKIEYNFQIQEVN